MQVIQIGNIAASLTAHMAESIPYVEDDILEGIVKEILPDCGIVIQAEKEEIMNNNGLGGILYSRCRVVKEND